MAAIVYHKTQDQDNVYLDIDLVELFGDNIIDDTAVREAFGQFVIDEIVARTQSGIGVNGRPFKRYSDKYVASDDFSAFGKSPTNVDLTLTGSMLDGIQVIDSRFERIRIGWNDSDESAKAHGHITGKNGEVPKMKRDFFGLPERELESLARTWRDDFVREQPERERVGTLADILSLLEAGGVEIF